jgi:predicted nucleic acid-binding protein
VKTVTLRLGPGEQQAIALAYELKTLLLIDDRLGRTAARRLGLPITGLAGVLIQAKEANLIPAVLPILDEVRWRGYWLCDELLEAVAKLTGETI